MDLHSWLHLGGESGKLSKSIAQAVAIIPERHGRPCLYSHFLMVRIIICRVAPFKLGGPSPGQRWSSQPYDHTRSAGVSGISLQVRPSLTSRHPFISQCTSWTYSLMTYLCTPERIFRLDLKTAWRNCMLLCEEARRFPTKRRQHPRS